MIYEEHNPEQIELNGNYSNYSITLLTNDTLFFWTGNKFEEPDSTFFNNKPLPKANLVREYRKAYAKAVELGYSGKMSILSTGYPIVTG